MTPIIDQLCAHGSIRKFTDQPIKVQQRDAILASAQATSSSSFLQCVSIIRVTDAVMREKLVQYSGDQRYVADAAEFWVFCADFNRHWQIFPSVKLGQAEQLLIGVVDTAMMGQSALLAAESLGLGGVFIGGIRNHIAEVTDLLALPRYVLPLFGLCMGWPARDPQCKPRLPAALVMFENQYQLQNKDLLRRYDEQYATYYASRSKESDEKTWSAHIRQTMKKEMRPFILHYLQQQGWLTS